MPPSKTLLLLAITFAAPPAQSDYFKIKVVDEQTGRGMPLVELSTVNNVRYYTDSAGVLAFYEPGLMDRPVFFQSANRRKPGYDNRRESCHA